MSVLWYFKKYPMEQYRALTVEDDRELLRYIIAGVPKESALQVILVKRWMDRYDLERRGQQPGKPNLTTTSFSKD